MACSENNKKRFLGKATGHNDHYMISMGGQRQIYVCICIMGHKA